MHETRRHPGQAETWKSGESYQQYVGRWSRLVAREFIKWMNAPSRQHWLDVGCGTGVLSQTILGLASPAAVRGIDPSQSHIAYARDSLHDDRVAFSVGTADNLQFPDDSFDVVVSGLVLNFVADPAGGVREMRRVMRSGGIIGAYVWDYADKMELIRYFWDAAADLDETALVPDEGKRFPLCSPGPLKELFTGAGLRNVDMRPIDVPTRFENFDDYWLPFLGGQGPAPGYAMSLSEERRSLLRDRIRSILPFAGDGSINLTARAWAIRGSDS